MEFFVARDQKVIGPCTLQDLRSFLYYGSLKMADKVMRNGDTEWVLVSSIPELSEFNPDSEENKPKSFVKKLLVDKPKPPPRIMRYQDYSRVPHERRAGYVLWRLFFGFLIWPPSLWRAAAIVFSSNVYMKKKDGNGFHKVWPRWIEIVVALMIIINGIAWWLGIMWLWPRATKLTQHLIEMGREAARDAQNALNKPAP